MHFNEQINCFNQLVEKSFPLQYVPLVQCITNEITCESMANALLYIDAKPVMADDIREHLAFAEQTSSLLLNLGHLSIERETSLLVAAEIAKTKAIPFVIDLVGVAASPLRVDLAYKLLQSNPTVVKGNISEMRAFVGLKSNARGVDTDEADQGKQEIQILIQAMKQEAVKHPQSIYLATGKKDLVVTSEQAIILSNGVEELDRFTGTGDIVGALIAALLGAKNPPLAAVISAVSYFNICGESAKVKTVGLADFRQETLNQLSLLMNQKNWFHLIRGGIVC